MAYLDLDNIFQAPGSSRVATVNAPASAPLVGLSVASFSAVEWSVIALARRDTLRSLAEPGAVVRAMGKLFGLATQSRLADPRLEALRRVAVHAWRRGFALPLREIEHFVGAGFSEAQLETLVSSVTGMRVGRR